LLGALEASTAGLALTHTVAKAVWAGIFTSGKPFLRTPKCEDPAMLSQVLRLAWQETALLIACIAALVSMMEIRGFDDPAAILWMVMLAIQTMPYAATTVIAVLSAFSNTHYEPAAASAAKPDPALPRAA
jgi:ABC-type sugar transport system permease subunit